MNNSIKKYPFKGGLSLEFEIVDLDDIFKHKKSMLIVPHRAQFYHVIWIERGKGTHYVDFNPINIEDNSIIFVPNNSVNLFDKDGTYKGKSIIFTDSFFCKNQQDLQNLHSSLLYSDLYDVAQLKINPAYSDLKVLLNAMQTEFSREQDAVQYGILHNLLHIFLLQSEREIRRQGFEEIKPSINLDYLMQFKNLLETNFRRERSVNKYTSVLNLSEKQLHKATTKLLDKTPKQLIDERVILESKRLLVHSTMAVKEVAYELGYDEPTNFIKYFRKHTALTPSEFREQYK